MKLALRRPPVALLTATLIPLLAAAPSASAAPPAVGNARAEGAARSASYVARTRDKVFRDRVEPAWDADGNSFWYRIQVAPNRHEFMRVDATQGIRRRAFDHERLATALEQARGESVDAGQLPLEQLVFSPAGKIAFRAFGADWQLDTETYQLTPSAPDTADDADDADDADRGIQLLNQPRPSSGGETNTEIEVVNRRDTPVDLFWIDGDGRRQAYESVAPGQSARQHTFAGHVWLIADAEGETLAVFAATSAAGRIVMTSDRKRPAPSERLRGRRNRPASPKSPDGQYEAGVRDHNVFVLRIEDGVERVLSENGDETNSYGSRLIWSPDSRYLLALQTEAGERRQITIVESSPTDQLQPKLHQFLYEKPGDRLDRPQPRLFEVESGKSIPIASDLFPDPWSLNDFQWRSDSSEFLFVYNQRGHQLLRVLAVDAATGTVRTLIEEQGDTFVHYSDKLLFHPTTDFREIVWMSERSGWNHLYRFDGQSGALINAVTHGAWPVRDIVRIDDENQQIWFRAGGVYPEQDPYYLHLCRVNFDGSGMTVLTAADGTHTWEMSPDGRFLIDRWSRVDAAPVHELRRSDDGRLICELERADWSALLDEGWNPPQRFVAKGRDQTTDIYGILVRPTHFDPSRKYPVVEDIYAGPHGSFTPKAFDLLPRMHEIAELGFVVVKLDGMGTNHRGKAFHDVCWKNLGDSGFPDRIAWMRAAARLHPELDLSRVGIFGGSAGGQSAVRALLAHGDFYDVAVADCGCHDNRMDKIWWNEQWMGSPIDPHYEQQSNVTQAHRLQGKLLLTVGELDRNVDPASTMQVVDALIRADKDFELIVFPGGGHGSGESPYGKRKRREFFVRHLLTEPGPEVNSQAVAEMP